MSLLNLQSLSEKETLESEDPLISTLGQIQGGRNQTLLPLQTAADGKFVFS